MLTSHSTSAASRRAAKMRRYGLVSAVLVLLVAALTPAAAPVMTSSPNGDEVLRYLGWTVDWYRRIATTEDVPVNSQDVLYHDNVRRAAREVLQLSFQYARAEAVRLAPGGTPSTSPTTGKTTGSNNLAVAAARAAQVVADLKRQIAALDAALPSAQPTSRPFLDAKREKLVAQLNFFTSEHDVVQGLSGYVSGVENGHAAGIADEINDLERSVPDAKADDTATAAATPKPATPDTSGTENFRPQSAGILGLISELFTLNRRMREIDESVTQTEGMIRGNDYYRSPLKTELSDAVKRGNALSATTQDSDEPSKLAGEKQELEALSARFKFLSASAVPLRKQNAIFESIRSNLVQWHTAIDRVYSESLRLLLYRIGGMAASIIVLLGISVLWKRGTFRYVKDIRRRRQFLVVRRIVVSTVIILVIIASFITEFGSLATYAGLLTAGIAVALQTVIVSGFAYFFFAGRYGVRVGDRVTVAGVTGDIIDVGLFRLYLMELQGADRDLRPSGRIVIFSNAVLFQPTPFFKQIPGAEYVWHQFGMTLSPDSDYELAEAKLLEAVNTVFETYRTVIERQHAEVQRSTQLPLPTPRPEAWLRLVDAGLEFVVRYPVEIRRAAEIDDLITHKLLQTIEREPKLKMVATSAPKIQAKLLSPPAA